LNRYFHWNENKSDIDDIVIFGRTSIGKYIRITDRNEQKASVDLLQNILHMQLKKIPELDKIGKNGRRTIHFHALREYFYTTVSNISGSNFAHALMGHHEYLDTYYTLPEKEKVKLYQKTEPYLTISDFSKIEEELEKTQEKQKGIEETHTKLMQFLKQKDPSFEEFSKIIS